MIPAAEAATFCFSNFLLTLSLVAHGSCIFAVSSNVVVVVLVVIVVGLVFSVVKQ